MGARQEVDESVFRLDGTKLTRETTYPNIPGSPTARKANRTTQAAWEKDRLVLEMSQEPGFHPAILRRFSLGWDPVGRLEVISTFEQLGSGGGESVQWIYIRLNQRRE